FYDILPALVVGGIGMAITMAPTTSAAMGAVPVDKAGVGSAVINSMRQVGGSLGIAIMGTLIATQISVAPASPELASQFVDGYHHALQFGAGLLIVGAFVALLTIKPAVRPQPERQRAAEAITEGQVG